MRNFSVVPVIIGFLVGSCVTPSGTQTKSSWSLLNQAEKVQCLVIPKSIHDIEIEDMDYINTDNGSGFVTSMKGRDGAQRVYFLDQNILRSNEATPEDLQKMEFGDKFHYLGSFEYKGSIHLVIEKEGLDQTKWIEIREFKKNVVLASSEKYPSTLRTKQALVSSQGLWLFTTEDTESDDDSTKLKFGAIDWDKNKIAISKIRDFSIGTSFRVITQNKGPEATVFWMSSEQDSQQGYSYSYQVFNGVKALSGEKRFLIKNGLPLENWTVKGNSNTQFWLLMIVGDSLLGNANLLIVDMQKNNANNIQVQKVSTLGLADRHFSIPSLASIKNKPILILPTWLDSESTIALYEMEHDLTELKGAKGIFPEGTALKGVFSVDQSNELWAAFKNQEALSPTTQLCRLM